MAATYCRTCLASRHSFCPLPYLSSFLGSMRWVRSRPAPVFVGRVLWTCMILLFLISWRFMVWLGGSSCVFYHGGGGLVEHGGFVVRLAAAFRNIYRRCYCSVRGVYNGKKFFFHSSRGKCTYLTFWYSSNLAFQKANKYIMANSYKKNSAIDMVSDISSKCLQNSVFQQWPLYWIRNKLNLLQLWVGILFFTFDKITQH